MMHTFIAPNPLSAGAKAVLPGAQTLQITNPPHHTMPRRIEACTCARSIPRASRVSVCVFPRGPCARLSEASRTRGCRSATGVATGFSSISGGRSWRSMPKCVLRGSPRLVAKAMRRACIVVSGVCATRCILSSLQRRDYESALRHVTRGALSRSIFPCGARIGEVSAAASPTPITKTGASLSQRARRFSPKRWSFDQVGLAPPKQFGPLR